MAQKHKANQITLPLRTISQAITPLNFNAQVGRKYSLREWTTSQMAMGREPQPRKNRQEPLQISSRDSSKPEATNNITEPGPSQTMSSPEPSQMLEEHL